MLHGVINIHKQKGFTSHDVVAKLRGILGQKKIGHTGTLDPDATGVLPVCLGKATKLCDMLTDKSKIYETVLLLGCSTDTQDISGEIVNQGDIQHLDEETVRNAVKSFVGEYNQVPPMYSALKVNGKKLYELARQGVTVERKARSVVIYSIRILEIDIPRVRMEVHCSKGTYIRTFCSDIGEKLGCGGCMEELVRTKVSCFDIEDSLTLDEVVALRDMGTLQSKIVPIDEMFSEYMSVTILSEFAALAYNGNPVLMKHLADEIVIHDGKKVRLYDHEGQFVGVYIYDEAKQRLQLFKMFYERTM